METIGTWWMWAGLFAIVLVMLAIDLFVVGGGKADKFAVYAHMTVGLGVIAAKDGATGTSLVLPGIHAAAGIGAHGYLTRRLSLGTLIDFGYMGGLGVDAFLTLGLHFGKKPK